jgi:PadR family transcriptional regulator PadR
MTRPRNVSPQTRSALAALLEVLPGWCHGYALSKRTGLKSGTLYPLLMRLGDQGLLESKWEPSPGLGRPPRHVYRLTRKGIALASEQAAAESGTFGAPIGQKA